MSGNWSSPTGAMRLLMRSNTRQQVLISALAGMLVLAATSVSGVALYLRAVEALVSEVRYGLLHQALSSAAALDVDQIQLLTDPSQESGPVYRQVIQPLERIRRVSPDVRFIYTCAMREGVVCFVLDPTPPGDADGDGVEDHSPLFQAYREANPIMRGVLASGIAATDDQPVEDKWGTTFSGYAPLRDSSGQLVGVLGIDLDVKTYQDRIAAMRGAAWSGGVLAVACAVLVSLGCLIALRVVRSAVRVTHDRHGQLIEAREQAERADRAKGDFLAMMSHEIRTPLNAVVGLADLLASGGLDEVPRGHAETIRASGEHLLAMINDILDYSKIEAGRMDLLNGLFSPAVVAEQAVRLLSESARAKGIRLDLEFGPEIPPAVLGDQLRLRQVLLNLIGNAVKFTAHGGVRVTVTSMAGATGAGALHFAVSDTGIGIERATFAGLFQPFRQAATVRGGSGLGLAISQRLVRLMGGEITIESAPGTGSTFTFTVVFPLAPPDARAPTSLSLHPPRFSGRVLVVDDQAVNRVLASTMLSRLGVDCEVVDCGDTALARLRESDFDLVLMDVQMPDRDGLKITADLRQEQHRLGRRTPVVALTASASTEDEKRCRAAGMDGYLTKPLRIEALAGELERWLPVVHDGLPPTKTVLLGTDDSGPAPLRPAVIDLSTLATLRSLDSDAREFTALVDGYLATTRRQMEVLTAEVQSEQVTEVERLAHAQRGAALTMGLVAFAAALSALERVAKAKHPERFPGALATVEQEFARAAAALASVRGQG